MGHRSVGVEGWEAACGRRIRAKSIPPKDSPGFGGLCHRKARVAKKKTTPVFMKLLEDDAEEFMKLLVEAAELYPEFGKKVAETFEKTTPGLMTLWMSETQSQRKPSCALF
jgi:hypothetical protein